MKLYLVKITNRFFGDSSKLIEAGNARKAVERAIKEEDDMLVDIHYVEDVYKPPVIDEEEAKK